MAKKVQKKARQLSLDLKPPKDERRLKVNGLILLLAGAWISLAFLSYLFTWYKDQDQVIHFGLSILFEGDVEVANWLGKLGALVSNFFIFFGFGIASFALVYQILRLGVFLLLERKLTTYWKSFRKAMVFMCTASIYLAFLFQEAAFPYGGAFGEKISTWLVGVLGMLGMSLLLLTVIIAIIIWYFNPDFNKMGTPLKVPAWLLKRNPYPDQTKDSSPVKAKTKVAEPDAGDDTFEFTVDSKETSSPIVAERKMPDLELETVSNPPSSEPAKKIPVEINTTISSLQDGNHPVINDDAEATAEPYDPTKELSRYKMPSLELLEDYSNEQLEIDREELEQNKDQILETLMHYKIEILKIRATIGPTVTLYEIVPAPGIKISRIRNLEDDIALSLSALGIRIIAPIPGKGTIGIEVPNKKKQVVGLREIIASDKFRHAKMDLPIAIGKTISNEPFVADLAKMPHLLIAGATGQGKSVGINSVLISLLFKKHPSQLKLVLIDPKKVELYPYGALANHFLAFLPEQIEPIVTDNNQVIYTLNSLCIEMDMRYELLKRAKTRNLREYNDKFVARRLNPNEGHRFMPFIVLVIDEFADLILTAGREVEQPLARLAQLARAVGIHLIIATQRPSVNIITGSIKANFPARIAFKVASKIDSRTILDGGGADQLIGQGDMLLNVGGDMIRLQGAFVDTAEVESVIDEIGKQQGFPEPYFLPEFNPDNPNSRGTLDVSELDELFKEAARLVVVNQHGSTSMIQRRLKLGYNRAGRIMDQLEVMGIVGAAEGSKPREVMIHSDAELERFLETV